MKIGYFITARLKSERLKYKLLKDLNGKTIFERVIERCLSVKSLDDVVICTSTNSQDSLLYDFALKYGTKFYAGSEADVMQRLLDAAMYYSFDGFVSITADNPLFSEYASVLLSDWARQSPDIDFIFTEGLPIGCCPYYLKTKALQVACYAKQQSDTEIWGPFVKQPSYFNIGILKFIGSLYDEQYRLTCDMPEDYKMLREIFNHFPTNSIPALDNVMDIIRKNECFEINKAILQRALEENVIDEIDAVFRNNIEKINEYAKTIGYATKSAISVRKIEI